MSGKKRYRRRRKKKSFKILLILTITMLITVSVVFGALYLLDNPGIFNNKVADNGETGTDEESGKTDDDDSDPPKKEKQSSDDKDNQDKASDNKNDDSSKDNDSDNTGENTNSSDNPALADDWMLILVNKDHPIPEGYEVPELTVLRNDQAVDSRIYPSLQKMFDDARAQGIMPGIRSSYRTYEEQQAMMDNKIKELMDQGMSKKKAKKEAKLWVAVPGTSEHQLGLSVDISTADWEKQDANIVWEWLNTHCVEYGFVQRYPEDKVDITGINNEPWHYRYVGLKAAQEMKEKGMCLEEYLGE